MTEAPRSRQTARTLAILSAALLVIAAMVLAPEAGLLCAGLGLAAALPALAWGSARVRAAVLVLVVATVALMVELYPQVAR